MQIPLTDKKLQKALDQLADLYEYGHLDASTNPARFAVTVAEDVSNLRSEVDRLKAENEKLREALQE